MKMSRAKMQFLPLVGNAFLRKSEQHHFKNIALYWLFNVLKKSCEVFSEISAIKFQLVLFVLIYLFSNSSGEILKARELYG